MGDDRLEVTSLNCWGLLYISQYTTERIHHIAETLASSTCDVVCLQEVWQQRHWNILKSRLKAKLPYAKFYYSGMFGSGLAILSRYPISQTDMRPYTLNGRPQAFFRGDWYVGKGVASAIIDLPNGRQCQVFNTHMHAPYNEKVDTYLCHRTAQAWELKKVIEASVKAGYLTLATGDFNSTPGSLVHRILTTRLSDSFITLNPDLPLLADHSQSVMPQELIEVFGVTCDVSPINTWRATQAPSSKAKRLDYLLHNDDLIPEKLAVVFTDLVPSVQCSPSDHFGLHAVYKVSDQRHENRQGQIDEGLTKADYAEMADMLRRYTERERLHSDRQIVHFWASILSIPLLLYFAYGATPMLQFISTLLLLLMVVTGLLSGIIGAFFGWWELRNLQEYGEEIELARSTVK